MGKMEVKSLDHPEEIRTFAKGHVDLVKIGGVAVGRATFEPGWRWSEHVRPLVQTLSCQAPHFQYHLTGVLHIVMDDGTEVDLKAGDVSLLPPGHDAWVVGDEPVVVIDFQGMVDYAKAK
jgi:quercetin dioxygenase-like cupin family protein